MPSPVLAILLLVVGLACSFFLLILFVAGSANTQPGDYAVMKATMLGLLIVGGASTVVTIAGFALGRPAIAVTASLLPLAMSVLALFVMLELSRVQVDRSLTPTTANLAIRAILLVIFGGGGLAMFYVGAREHALQRALLVDAQPVPAKVLESDVQTSSTKRDETPTHRPEVRFRYTVDGVEYESDLLRPSAIGRTYASRDAAAAELAAFPKDATVTAYVSPTMPEKGYLVRDRSAGPTVFLIVGALLVPIALLAGRLI